MALQNHINDIITAKKKFKTIVLNHSGINVNVNHIKSYKNLFILACTFGIMIGIDYMYDSIYNNDDNDDLNMISKYNILKFDIEI